jgi:hypothetical protein
VVVAVRAAARRYGADASPAIEALLARDPLELGVKPPKRPACVRTGDLPPVALVTGGVLDDAARDALLEVLQISPVAPPYPGLALVREACDPASLGAFARELVEQWVVDDAHGRHAWMLFAAVHFPSDAGARRIAELARGWARSRQSKAEYACAALAALGTDVALMQLARLAATTRFDALRRAADALLVDAADARGLTPDELADRTVPDAGLGRDGTLALAFGRRELVVSLDELLQPIVFEVVEGQRRLLGRALPRATKADDAAAVKLARARFKALGEDVASVADGERRRLERAMIEGRAWTAAEFRARVVEHPLDLHLARRLVWIAATPDGARAFRVAEDASYADVADDAFALPDDARVWLAHPAREPAQVAGWARVFADYEIMQPFEQLARAVYAIEPDERDAEQLARVAGIEAPARKLLGVLEARGFRRDYPGSVKAFARPARGAGGEVLDASLPMLPGFDIEGLAHAPPQTTAAARLTDASGRPVPFGALDVTSFSELVRDVAALRSLH